MNGGSTGKGGSSGTGGSTGVVDAGKLADSGSTTDAKDAPFQGNETGTIDGSKPVLLDSGLLDQGSPDVEAIDTMVVHLDAEIDAERLDTEVPDVATST